MNDISKLENLVPTFQDIMRKHGVRLVWSEMRGDTLAIGCHLNDAMNCDPDAICREMKLAALVDVSFPGVNTIFVTRRQDTIPGTIAYRFVRLMSELEKRFPRGTQHRMFCAEPPESHMLREIDATMANIPASLIPLCPHCKIDMAHGVAIDPKRVDNALYIMPPAPLSWPDVDIIPVWKCPACGHSDDGK